MQMSNRRNVIVGAPAGGHQAYLYLEVNQGASNLAHAVLFALVK